MRRIRGLVAALGMELQPDKTFVGRIDHGFEFLGIGYGPEGVQVADGTILSSSTVRASFMSKVRMKTTLGRT